MSARRSLSIDFEINSPSTSPQTTETRAPRFAHRRISLFQEHSSNDREEDNDDTEVTRRGPHTTLHHPRVPSPHSSCLNDTERHNDPNPAPLLVSTAASRTTAAAQVNVNPDGQTNNPQLPRAVTVRYLPNSPQALPSAVSNHNPNHHHRVHVLPQSFPLESSNLASSLPASPEFAPAPTAAVFQRRFRCATPDRFILSPSAAMATAPNRIACDKDEFDFSQPLGGDEDVDSLRSGCVSRQSQKMLNAGVLCAPLRLHESFGSFVCHVPTLTLGDQSSRSSSQVDVQSLQDQQDVFSCHEQQDDA